MDTIISAAIQTAHRKGYRVNRGGKVVSPFGKFRKLRLGGGSGGRPQYYTFNIVDDRGKRVPIPVHRLVALQKYPRKSMREGVRVRHLDGDHLNNRPSNIAVGTESENHFDVPEKTRIARAKHAATFTRKLSDFQLRRLKRDRSRGMNYRDLSAKYHIAKSAISRIVNGTLYC